MESINRSLIGISPEELRIMCRAHGVSRLSDSESDNNEEAIAEMLERNKPSPQMLLEDVEVLKQKQLEAAEREEAAAPPGLRASVQSNKSRKGQGKRKSTPISNPPQPHMLPSTNSVHNNIPINVLNQQYYLQQPQLQNLNLHVNHHHNQNFFYPRVDAHLQTTVAYMPHVSHILQRPIFLLQGVQTRNYAPNIVLPSPNQFIPPFINPRQCVPGPMYWDHLQSQQQYYSPLQYQNYEQPQPSHPGPVAQLIPKNDIPPVKQAQVKNPKTVNAKNGSRAKVANGIQIKNVPSSSKTVPKTSNDFVLSKKTTKPREYDPSSDDIVVGANSFSLLAPSSDSESSDIENDPSEIEVNDAEEIKAKTELTDKSPKRKKNRKRNKKAKANTIKSKATNKHIDLDETQERFVLKDKKNNIELEDPEYDVDDDDDDELELEDNEVPKWWVDRKVRIMKGQRGMDRFIPVTEVQETMHIREDILEKMINNMDNFLECRERAMSMPIPPGSSA